MGINRYQSFLRIRFGKHFYHKFSEILAKSHKKFVKRLFIDWNALIHVSAHEAYTTSDPNLYRQMQENPEYFWISEGGVSDRLFQNVFDIVKETKPQNLLYLAADGVVTRAKMMQQRQRTYAHLLYETGIFDPTLVKPGTAFMEIVIKDFVRRLRSHVKANRSKWPSKIVISDSNIPGEGEHKIMQELVIIDDADRNASKGMDVIYSPDSDMQVLTTLHSRPNDQTIVMRQVHGWDFLDPKASPHWEYYDSTAIRDEIDLTMKYEDFAFIVSFAGNDFLPSLPLGMNPNRTKVFDRLIETYKKVFPASKGEARLLNGRDIDFPNLLLYLRGLKYAEEELLVDMLNYQHGNPEKFIRRNAEKEIIEDHRWDLLETTGKDANVAKGPDDEVLGLNFVYQIFTELYRRRVSGTWEDSTPYSGINFDAVPEMCHDYLSGLWWITNYYMTQTKEINTNWCYPHHYAPTVDHLIKYLESHLYEDYTRDVRMFKEKEETEVTSVEHLLMILPREKLHLVNPIVKSTFLELAPDLYPESFQVDRTFVEVKPISEYSSEVGNSKILLNFPSLERISGIFDIVRSHVKLPKPKLITITNSV
jgi:5'-3' exonuclease